jgi:hypothetical protein
VNLQKKSIKSIIYTTFFFHLASYAGIAKMQPSTGPASNVNSTSTIAPRGGSTSSTVPPSTSQQPNAVRAPVKALLTTANRPNSNAQSGQQQQQQQRGNGNYYQQNNRGNYWNDNSQQDHNSTRRSGANVGTGPNGHQVFVGSLPSDFKKETLIEFFGKYGTVLDAKIHTPNNENKKVCCYLNSS